MFSLSAFMYFDIAMPLTLFTVTIISLLLNEKVEGKLKMVFEEKQLQGKDAVLLAVLMGVIITLIATSIKYGFENSLMVLFLFSCSILLFMFTYVLLNRRWYLATVPPAVFILLYLLLRNTAIWLLYLANIYSAVFAILAILYLGCLFTWKATWVFACLITLLDILLVFVTKAMVDLAKTGLGLGLPIAVMVPIFPPIMGINYFIGLGLGDFFLAGLLSIQILKRYGKTSAFLSVTAISIAFFIFEVIYFIPY
ncbi:MAG: hypothetical protein QXH37_09390, partial [Candidatus Bathyarchaeia archaeon]